MSTRIGEKLKQTAKTGKMAPSANSDSGVGGILQLSM